MSGTTFDDYQAKALITAIYPEAQTGSTAALAYVALGLAGEAGEVTNKIKKILRDTDGAISADMREDILDELGDVLWYAAQLASELNASFNDVADDNISKLLDRKNRGVLKGSGDQR